MPSAVADIPPGLRISSFYRPTAKQNQFHSNPAKFRAQIGGFGSGKTRALLMEAIRYAMTIPGCNCLIIRRTHRELMKTVINLLLNPSQAGLGVQLEDLGAYYNKQEHICYFQHAGGIYSKIFFGYCDEGKDVNQYLSTEYVFVGIEEAGEFPFAVWTALIGRNRCPIQKDIFGHAVRPSAALATNPFGVGYGWIKKLFVDHEAVGGMTAYSADDYFFVHSTLFDNPVYASDAQYIATLESLPEAEKRKKLYGDLEQITGQYYINFDPDPRLGHVIPYGQISFQKWHPRWIGIDWGFAHALAVIFFAQADVERNGAKKTVTIAYDELVLHQKTEEQVVAEIVGRIRPGEQFANIFLSHETFGTRDGHRTIAQLLGDQFIKRNLPQPNKVDAGPHARVSGWKLAYNLFETGDLLIADTCRQLIHTIPLLTRDGKDIEDIQKTETDEDDIADAWRYGLKGFLAPGNVPLEVVLDAKLVAAKSNTERFMIQQRFEQDHRGEDALTLKVPKRRFW